MKRILFFAAALCSVLLCSCDNDNDAVELSPIELEIMELEELIASQTEIDEEALVADLCRGTVTVCSRYSYDNGVVEELELPYFDGYYIAEIFFADGTALSYSYTYALGPGRYTCRPFYWRYDSETQSLITKVDGYFYAPVEDQKIEYEELSAKVRYYNTEDHRLILDGKYIEYGYMFTHTEDGYVHSSRDTRLLCHIDIDPAERERVLGLCDDQE